MKQCSKCRSVKPVEAFHKQAKSKDGLQYRCKACQADYMKTPKAKAVQAARAKTPAGKESLRKRQAKYRQTPEGKATASAYNAAYRQTPMGKEVHRKESAKYQQTEKGRRENAKRRATPEGKLKVEARWAVWRAIQSGKLKPAWWFACDERCGHVAQEYHHHRGYGKSAWLEVVPLCIPCHKAEHKLLVKLAQNLAKGLGINNRSGPTEQDASVKSQ